jgi:hypothetical protein
VGESEMGNKWRWEEDSREGWGFYTGFLVLGARCTRRVILDVEGCVSGRHCRLSLGMWSAVSVAQRSGRGGLRFRPCVTETGLAWVGTHGQGARRWGQRVDGIVPCQFGCRATRVWPRARWNTMPAPGAPGGSLTSVWHGRVASYGRAKVKPPRGIDPRCRGGSGGEVTGRGVDGGLLALPGCPRLAWRRPGRRGVAGLVLCHAGSG